MSDAVPSQSSPNAAHSGEENVIVTCPYCLSEKTVETSEIIKFFIARIVNRCLNGLNKQAKWKEE